MKYRDALKIAMTNESFVKKLENLKDRVNNNHAVTSLQFSVDGECFYYSGEALYDEELNDYVPLFEGGKHTKARSKYLLERGETMVIR